jgi:hypothetical protein
MSADVVQDDVLRWKKSSFCAGIIAATKALPIRYILYTDGYLCGRPVLGVVLGLPRHLRSSRVAEHAAPPGLSTCRTGFPSGGNPRLVNRGLPVADCQDKMPQRLQHREDYKVQNSPGALR